MRPFRKKLLILVLILVVLYSLTYIPHRIVAISSDRVSSIEIFDGSQGKGLTLTDKTAVRHIISNLNGITFSKGKCSFGYMGYRFRVKIFKENGRKYKEFIINSNGLIRYNGFFYVDKSKSIDYSYLDRLLKNPG